MELPELFATGDLTSLAIAAGLVVVGFLLLWLVVRSAVLSALTAHEKRRERDAAAVGPRRGASTAGEQDIAGSAPTNSAPAPQAAPAPVAALTPPVGEVHPAPPYVPDAASLPPVTVEARQPQPQPSNAAAAAAALFQSRPAAQAPAAAAGAMPSPPPMPAQAPHPAPAAAPVAAAGAISPSAPAPTVGSAAPPQQAIPADIPVQNSVQVPEQRRPQHAMPPQNAVQPQPTVQPGQPIVMSASQPDWAPPAPTTGNPFHVAGEAPLPAPYELPVGDPAAPRRF